MCDRKYMYKSTFGSSLKALFRYNRIYNDVSHKKLSYHLLITYVLLI